MNDLISRRQAIEEFAMTAPQMSVIHIYEAVEILESMPSAEPETEERMPETEQNVPDTDLISRKAAIEALIAYRKPHDCGDGTIVINVLSDSSIEQVLTELPSAHPESTMGQLTELSQSTKDCISREAAIDALWKALFEYEDKTEKQFLESDELDVADWIQHRNFVQNMSDIDRQTILNLPSVEPVRCKDCKHRYMEDMTWHCPFGLMGGENFFCGYGSSAEPEIIRCKDCKHYDIFPNGTNGMCKKSTDAWTSFYPWDFCSHGERRTDERS